MFSGYLKTDRSKFGLSSLNFKWQIKGGGNFGWFSNGKIHVFQIPLEILDHLQTNLFLTILNQDASSIQIPTAERFLAGFKCCSNKIAY